MRTFPEDEPRYEPIAAIPSPGEVFVDEDLTDRIPFGFQRPARPPAMKRTPSRQARAARWRNR